jgi:hypothetical protein
VPEFTVSEAERGYLKYVLRDGKDWSDEEKRGEPIARDDVEAVYFSVKERLSVASPIISLSDANDDEIEWLDEDAGVILVKLGTQTEGHAGDNQVYELRLKSEDGTYLTVESGTIHILDSLIDTP